jgi:hypothetical protein
MSSYSLNNAFKSSLVLGVGFNQRSGSVLHMYLPPECPLEYSRVHLGSNH